ncbi:MAG: NADH-ubiquinone oxidoreductase-F iron-sulfur binding region domain-containing protein [Acetobacteraceae bacterium]
MQAAPRHGATGAHTIARRHRADAEATRRVLAALDGLPLRRDLLIEHLHRLQDRLGGLRRRYLAALAEVLRLAPVEVFEVASFYAHFDLLEDDAPAPTATIRVCTGLPCAMAGADELLAALRGSPPGNARILPAPCMGACDHAPVAATGHATVLDATPARVAAGTLHASPQPALPALEEGWPVLRALRSGVMDTAGVLAALDGSGLRGMGGAGFPAARKWRAVLAQPGPRHLVVNADEGEPGTFKDRWCLEHGLDRVLEGMLVAAHVIGAEACWIYLRDEYPEVRAALEVALPRLSALGVPHPPVHLRRGAGAYICGEETALLESLEGRRGYPRHKPPYPGESGLFGRPTLIHNVETLWWLPDILAAPGAAARFAAAGRNGARGRRLFSLSGRVARPGVHDAPAGITARELIEEFGGGMAEGHRFAAYLPGGASGGILPARLADRPLQFGALDDLGCFVGSGAVVVLSDRDDLAEAARNLVRFFRDESCGQCTPCRVGTAKAARLLDEPRWNRALLRELAAAMADGSICGLGQAAMNPVLSLLRHFPEEALP